MYSNRQTGYYGEELALGYLEQNGYRIIRQNYYTRGGEVDIIAWDDRKKELVFIEVKARTNQSFGYPEDAIDDYKLNRMFNCAENYINESGYRGSYRFDCLAIELDKGSGLAKINYYENIS